MRKRMFSGAESLLFKRASELRNKQTFSEELLWNYLRTKPFGFKFRRQHPFSCYILDFYCHQLQLAIEVDGLIHEIENVKRNDEIRQKQLELGGLIFLRFTNDEIKLRPEEIISQIETFLKRQLKTNETSKT